MDTLLITPARRLHAQQTYGPSANAFDAVALRPPSSARATNAPEAAEPTLKELIADLPGWVTIVAGGVFAALMGALVGGMLAL